jgi:hypothetical protein
MGTNKTKKRYSYYAIGMDKKTLKEEIVCGIETDETNLFSMWVKKCTKIGAVIVDLKKEMENKNENEN